MLKSCEQLSSYLQGQHGVAVAVRAKHVLLHPGLLPQRSSGARELGRSDDVAGEGLLQGRGVSDGAGNAHAAASAVVPAPRHAPAAAPAVPLVAPPRGRFHHGLSRQQARG